MDSQLAPALESGRLKRTLSNRQIGMIAIGGVIGAGLFAGSGGVIHSAGPAVIVAYIGIGAVLVLIMRMLAELAVASPDSGSFASYAARELGPWSGVTLSYLYMYTWMITIGYEATAAASIMHSFVPAVAPWVWALIFMVAFTGINLAAAKVFGEFEFWISLIKVLTIGGFILFGVLAILGFIPGFESPGLSNFTGSFVPNGWTPVWLATVTVFFSFFGSESVTIAAAEAKDPAMAVRRAIRTVVARILVFYVGSIAVIIALVPAGDGALLAGPYALVFERLGLPAAAVIMSIVIITAMLSLMNSGIFVTSRMIYAAADRGELPKSLTVTNKRGVPVRAVLFASTGGFLTVAANYFVPGPDLFMFLLSSSGAIAVFVYAFIAVTQLRSRARMGQDGAKALALKMWAHPFGGIVVLAALASVIVALAYAEETRLSLALSTGAAILFTCLGFIHQKRKSLRPAVLEDDPATEEPRQPATQSSPGV
ncbi:amino acid permease [Paenarthrobacter sp. NPDC089322]|uniref:amino acid permease n=1 Tax=Paenarthrobacter sp. NPDC089322 TaxID=3155065 RepID=UPI00342711F7